MRADGLLLAVVALTVTGMRVAGVCVTRVCVACMAAMRVPSVAAV